MLEVRRLNAFYGQAQALFDVNFQVPLGSLVLVQGLNGAGKSTLLKSLMGLMDSVQGETLWKGQSLLDLAPHQRAQAGLGYVPEDRRLFSALTVRQNLEIAMPSVAKQRGAGLAPVHLEDVLRLFPALAGMLNRPASQMSGGEQQMLALGRTLMTQPQMLLLDEPCEGISPVLVQSIAQALAKLKQGGYTLLIAEQNKTLHALADQVLNLAGGVVQPVPASTLSKVS